MDQTERLADRIFFFFQAEDGIRDDLVTGVQTCALPISAKRLRSRLLRLIARFRSLCSVLRLARPVSASCPARWRSARSADLRCWYWAICNAIARSDSSVSMSRSEERRVGKECRSRWSPY